MIKSLIFIYFENWLVKKIYDSQFNLNSKLYWIIVHLISFEKIKNTHIQNMNNLLELPQQNREQRYTQNKSTKKRKYGDTKRKKTGCTSCYFCYKNTRRGCRYYNKVYQKQEIDKLAHMYNQGMFDIQ